MTQESDESHPAVRIATELIKKFGTAPERRRILMAVLDENGTMELVAQVKRLIGSSTVSVELDISALDEPKPEETFAGVILTGGVIGTSSTAAARMMSNTLDRWFADEGKPATDQASLASSAKTRQLIADLTDPDPCSFDTRGGCQAHGYIDLQPGQMCPHEEAKEWVAAYDLLVAGRE